MAEASDGDADAELTASYRAAMARLPGGVAVLAGRSGGRDIVAVVTTLVSVSLEPPTVLVVIHAAGRLGEILGVGSRWAATIMGAGSRHHVAWIAEPGRPDVGQLQGIEHEHGATSGAAVLRAGGSWIEAVTTDIVEAGDHLVVIGLVTAAGQGSAQGALVHRLGRVRDLS